MKKILALLFAFFIGSTVIVAQEESSGDEESELLISGKYSGKNLVVTNPTVDGVYCINEIIVNGKKIDFTSNSNSFEIPLNQFLKNELVSVQIRYKGNGEPLVANPEVLIQDKRLNLPSFTFNKRSRLLTWDMKALDSSKNYAIEQFIYGKWSKVKDLGLPSQMISNTFPPVFNSGNNFFRMKEESSKGKILITDALKVKIQDRHVEPKSLKVTKLLEFNDVTHYEIIDVNGFFVKGGTAKTVDVSEFPKGDYFLNYDGKQAVINKK
ncbi:MAG: hypothetical protein MJZ76_04100 [Bacteroidales bacterium]|nr:hypothetical protein [Bacteroidales bacterium]